MHGYLWRTEALHPPGTGVTGGCEAPHLGAGNQTQVCCKNSIHAALTASPLSIPTQCVLDQGCSSVPWSSFRCMTLETVFELGNSTPHILVSWTRAMHFLVAVDFEIGAQQLKVSVSLVSGWPPSHCIQSGSFSSPSKDWGRLTISCKLLF